MLRRDFLKTSSVFAATALLSPNLVFGNGNIDKVNFNLEQFNTHNSQSIVIFLYGGASELAGNMTNFDQIQQNSQNSYPNIEVTPNGFWSDAGGELMEQMIQDKTMSIVRTIHRKADDSRSHLHQQLQNLKANSDDSSSGIFKNILHTLHENSLINSSTVIPSASIGESAIFANGNLINNSLLRPITIDGKLNNPYDLKYHSKMDDEQNTLIQELLANKNTPSLNDNSIITRLKENFFKRQNLSDHIETIKETSLPNEFPDTNIGESLSSMIKLMHTNSSSKLGFITYPNNWDDHSNSIDQYRNRHNQLIESLYSATQTLKALNNKTINIWVMTEFGRNVNLNDSKGWDHGNLFNLMVFSNNQSLKMGQIIGETTIDIESSSRIYTVPTENSISYEPYSIGSSLYRLFGITNPEILSSYPSIEELFS